MAASVKRVRPWWLVIPSLCFFLFLFSLHAKLELYGRGLREPVHPANSSKLCRDAHIPKVALTRIVLARVAVETDHRPTLHSEPLIERTFRVPVPRDLSLPYQRRLHRSPPFFWITA